MRDIKFRAWDYDNKRYQYFNLSDIQESVELLASYGDYFWNGYFTEQPLEQYTGLKDKNDKEIYENDQFIRNGHIGYVYRSKSGKWMIRFDDNKTFGLIKSKKWSWDITENGIIGNIHEETNS